MDTPDSYPSCPLGRACTCRPGQARPCVFVEMLGARRPTPADEARRQQLQADFDAAEAACRRAKADVERAARHYALITRLTLVAWVLFVAWLAFRGCAS